VGCVERRSNSSESKVTHFGGIRAAQSAIKTRKVGFADMAPNEISIASSYLGIVEWLDSEPFSDGTLPSDIDGDVG
jgi:hypothetical protein